MQAALSGNQFEFPEEENASEEEPIKLTPEASMAADRLLEKIKEDIKHGRPRADNQNLG